MELTPEFLWSFLRYDPATGIFTRKQKDGTWRPTGGIHRATGYRVIGINHRPYLAHRLTFLYETGEWPVGTVDHINGDRADNRWLNMRDVPIGINAQNRRVAQSNSSGGLLGVSHWPNRRGQKKYVAQVALNGQRVHCSYHATPEAAHEAYLTAKRIFHPGNTL